MQRTISAMVGKGSVNHNSRKFRAENVDGTRTHLNIDYCNENIKTVYHELFDEALERYNAKQIRSDRKIKDYYEKIRSSKQEKPFHEIILQVGGKGNMNADTENGELAKQILDEYYQGFQERNPQLVFYALTEINIFIVSPVIHFLSLRFSNGACLAAGIGVEIIEPLGVIDYAVKLCVNLFKIGLGVIIRRTHKLRLPSSYIRGFDFIYRLVTEKWKNMRL